MLTKIFLTAFALALMSTAAAAQCGAIPNTLTNGQNADATQVMTNFNHLRDCINNAPQPSGVDDVTRRNILLNTAMLAKHNAGYIRNINVFADGYKASDGINAGSSSDYVLDTTNGRVSSGGGGTTSYANPGGTGNRTASITVTVAGFTLGGGTASNLVDGVNAANTNDGMWITSGTGAITFDFGSGQYISEFKWYQPSTTSVLGNYNWDGSNDNSNWTTIKSSFALGGSATQTVDVTQGSPTLYRYYRLNYVSGTVTNNWNGEIEFKIVNSLSVNNMTLVTTTQTADATITKARALLEYNPIDAITLNTDLTVEVTCNGGTNWAAATLSLAGTAQAGRRVAETADTTCGTSGTLFAARIKTLNTKSIQIYKTTVSVQ
jgi:hypothetical protein